MNMRLENFELCEVNEVHQDLVKRVMQEMPDENTLYELSELFKVFGDSTRIRILYALYEEEICVCDLAEVLQMSQSAVSHQLKNLKNAKLIKSRREGKQVFYSLSDDHVATIIAMGKEHIEEA